MGVPTAVNITAILTVFSSVAFGILSFTFGFQNLVFLAFAGAGATVSSAVHNLYLVFAPIFTLFGLVASIVLLVGIRSKYLWYAMIVYMVTLFEFFVFYERNVLGMYYSVLSQLFSGHTVYWVQYGGLYPFIETGLAYLTPFVYFLGCIGYLFTEKLKRYFSID